MARHPLTRTLSLVTAAATGAALTVALTGGGAQVARGPHPTLDRHGPGSSAARVYDARLVSAVAPGPNTIYRYKLPTVSTGTFVVKFPNLPKAAYLVTYSLTAGASDSTSRLICWVDGGAGTTEVAFTYSAEWNHIVTNDGSGAIDARTKAPRLHCNATGTAQAPVTGNAVNAAAVSFLRADGYVARNAALPKSAG